MKTSFAFLAIMAVLLAVSTCHAGQDHCAPPRPVKNKVSVSSELDKAPEKARFRQNPLEHDPEAPLAGRKLFEQHCAECHGNAAEGGRHAPSLRIPEVQNAPPGAILWLITNGIARHGMPVWSKLPEPQRWQLVSYISSLRTNHVKSIGSGN
jgi:mono/diheme cytochrome c family protein